MKHTVLIATLVFWCGVAAILMLARTETTLSAIVDNGLPSPGEIPAAKMYALAEVAQHAGADSCWMIIHGRVYDVTAYAPRHPSPPALFLKYCGREATVGFETKDRGRPHSSAAQAQLEEFFIGFLASEPD